MPYQPSKTAIARVLLLAGILLAATALAYHSFFPAFAQQTTVPDAEPAMGTEEINYPENDDNPVVVYTAMDPEGETVFWSVVPSDESGANSTDADDFNIDKGVLTFKKSPDFEKPTDRVGGDNAAIDNTYVVQVRASDKATGGITHTITVTVKVQNVNEDGEVTFNRLRPKEGTPLEATLEDADGEPRETGTTPTPSTTDLTIASGTSAAASTTWQWARSMSKSGPWTVITATTTVNSSTSTRSRTPEEADAGYYLRATAMYNDGQAKEQTASGITTHLVQMKEYINTAPMFPDDDDDTSTTATTEITMEVDEDESLTEGAPVGDPVAAKDIGSDGMQEVLTYTLGGADHSFFTIDRGTGQIRLGAGTKLNHEDPDSTGKPPYVVTVTATDPASRSSEATVTIQVEDVDEAPEITSGPTAVNYDENSDTAGTANTAEVGTYAATDEDEDDADSSLKWTLSGTDARDFSISRAGVLSFRSPPDYEAPTDRRNPKNVYDVTVEVADDAGNKDSRAVAVTIVNVDEPGRVTLTSHPQPEVGQTIRLSLTDPDGVRSVTWTASIGTTTLRLSGTSPSHRVRATDIAGGETLTASAAYEDREGTGKTAALTPTVSVLAKPSPDEDPTFESTLPTTIDIAENSTGDVGSAYTATANDGDTVFLYQLSGTDARYFTIPVRTEGQIRVAEGTKLNYESGKRSYSVTLTADDPTGSTDRATIRLTINVTNEEEGPSITEGATTTNYAENGTGVVETYKATDDEDDFASPRRVLTWTLDGDDAEDFSITGGVLRFDSTLDFEAPADTGTDNVYNVIVQVDDYTPTGTTPTDQATRAVVITVTNEDEDGTVTFNSLQPKEGTPLQATLKDPDGEPRNTGTTPTPVTTDLTTGADTSATASTTWQWARSTSRSGPWTVINATSTDNTTTTTRTRTPEMADRGHYLRATAMYNDGEGQEKTAQAITANTVSMKDYVNTAPMFRDDDPDTTGSQITIEVDEDESLKEGAPVGDPVTAKDIGPDGITQEVLQYSLTVTPADTFTIDEATGQIKLGAVSGAVTKLDYEVEASREYSLVVTAEDPDELATTTTVTIKVMDVKEAPEFDAADLDDDDATNDNLTTVELVENTGTTTAVSSYKATDDEDSTDTLVKWSLDGADMDKFSLCNDLSAGCPNPVLDTVQLRFKEAPNFESPGDSGGNNVYNVTVVATDSEGMKASRDVTVKVTDMDEPATVILSSRAPEVGIRITARLDNPDGRTRGIKWQWYRCVDRTCATPAIISGATSQTYTPFPIDVGDDDDYLRATATYTDAAMGVDDTSTTDVDESKSDTANEVSALAVQAKDDDNTAPTLPDTAQRDIAENSPAGTVVDVPVAATDDEDSVTASGCPCLTYTMSGADEGSFEIASSTGQITVGKETELDYEGKRVYRVIVTATDPSGARDSVSVTINVTNMNEPPTVSQRGVTVTGPATVSHAENDTAAVATYRAVGPDASGALWSLSGPDASAFSIPGGELIFTSPPDFENHADANTDGTYNVTVMVRSGSFEDDQDVAVTIVNVDEPGAVTITPTTRPRVGVELTAALSDEDGAPSGDSWQWARSTSATGTWADIPGATSATYTPVDDDANNYLQATATYTDPQGSGKSASATTTDTVLAASTAGTPGTVAIEPTGVVVQGGTVTATLTDADNPTGTTWQWQRSRTGASGSGWDDIAGATSQSYTTVRADAGRYLRAVATYTDTSSTDPQTVESDATNTRIALHRYDGDQNGRIERMEVIKAINAFLFATGSDRITRAEVIEVINLFLFPGR